MIRIALADPTPAGRRQLRTLLEEIPSCWLRAVCSHVNTLLDAVQTAMVDLVVISLDDHPDALTAIPGLRASHPDLFIVVVGLDSKDLVWALKAGANKFLRPPVEGRDIRPILEEAAELKRDEAGEEGVGLSQRYEEVARQVRDQQYEIWGLLTRLEQDQMALVAAMAQRDADFGVSFQRPGWASWLIPNESQEESYRPAWFRHVTLPSHTLRDEWDTRYRGAGRRLPSLFRGLGGSGLGGPFEPQPTSPGEPVNPGMPAAEAQDLLDTIRRLWELRRNAGILLFGEGDAFGVFPFPDQLKTTDEVPPRRARLLGESTPDVVDCTIFAPPEVEQGGTILVQVFAHLPEQAKAAAAEAAECDEGARKRGRTSLAMAVMRNTRLTFHLAIPGLRINHPIQHLVWRGEAGAVQFGTSAPEGHGPGVVIGTVTISRAGVPVGHIKFQLRVVEKREAGPAPKPQPLGESARRYRKAFISYASEDRPEVLKRVQVLKQVGIDYFQDFLSLEPGTRWERELFNQIPQCDLFLLFWSTSAKESEWVMKEALHAVKCKGQDDLAPPEIKPVILEHPPPAPPAELAHLHFNDFLACLIGT